MAKLIFGLSQSLDGYVDHDKFMPGPSLFKHFTNHVREIGGCIYGRKVYELMQYWDKDQEEWDDASAEYAAAWRKKPKWVVSRTLDSVGPNATLIKDNVSSEISKIKDGISGDIDVAGPNLAYSLSKFGLIDEYHIYLRPFILGAGTPFFFGPLPPLHLIESDNVGEDAIRLIYVPQDRI